MDHLGHPTKGKAENALILRHRPLDQEEWWDLLYPLITHSAHSSCEWSGLKTPYRLTNQHWAAHQFCL